VNEKEVNDLPREEWRKPFLVLDATNNRFNEGKACEAVIRHIEKRQGCSRQNVRWPEQERHRAPIELICSVGDCRFAFEHTGIEPFEGHIELESQAHFKPLRDKFLARSHEVSNTNCGYQLVQREDPRNRELR
jgi:hypothetical protein